MTTPGANASYLYHEIFSSFVLTKNVVIGLFTLFVNLP